MAIVLTGPTILARIAAGQQQKAWNSRLISTCLRTESKKGNHLNVLLCYAPIRAASRSTKDGLLRDVEQAIAVVPPKEPYIMLGDLNAIVGTHGSTNDPWSRVRVLMATALPTMLAISF